MTNLIVNKDGTLFIDGSNQLKTDASGTDCCCVSDSCPTDCSSCASTFTATLSSITITYSGSTACGDTNCYNGNFAMSRSGCTWNLTDSICPGPLSGCAEVRYDLFCAGGVNPGWTFQLRIKNIPGGPDTNDLYIAYQPASGKFNSCPPTGTYSHVSTSSGDPAWSVSSTGSVSIA